MVTSRGRGWPPSFLRVGGWSFMVGLNTVSGEKNGVHQDRDYTLDGMTFPAVGAHAVMNLRVITGQASINIPQEEEATRGIREEPCMLRGHATTVYVQSTASYIGENEIPAVDGGLKHDTPTACPRVPGLGGCLRATAEDLESNPGSYRVRRVTLPRRCSTASNVTECSCCVRRPIHPLSSTPDRCFAVVGPRLEHTLACREWEAANSSSNLEAIDATWLGRAGPSQATRQTFHTSTL